MSAQHTPGPTWDACAIELLKAHSAARAERKLHGHVLPKTTRRINELTAQAQAAITIAAIAKATGSAA